MGLDSWVYAVKNKYVENQGETDVPLWHGVQNDNIKGCLPNKRVKKIEVFYWRKHHNLHDWMEYLYRFKGGTEESFNCTNVRLSKEDLDNLEKDILTDSLPKIWEYDHYEDSDLQFIVKARKFIDKNYALFYDSWW